MPESLAKAYDVFLSHSSKDKAVVCEIAEQLKKDGIRVWLDGDQIRPGDSIPAKIEEGLEHSRVLVFCMSANAFGSDWAQLESHTFRFRDPLNKERRLIPLRLDDTPVKGFFAQFLYVDWRHASRNQEYPKLLAACRGEIEMSPTLAPPLVTRPEAAGSIPSLINQPLSSSSSPTIVESISFLTDVWTERSWRKLKQVKKLRASELDVLADVFGNPFVLAKYYVEPDCQDRNPADTDLETPNRTSALPVFEKINSFLALESAVSEGGKNQMFVFGDAGMGKTSLLVMLKLAHLTAFWPKTYDCVLLKLGRDSMETIKKLSNRTRTVLLLDALDEDPLAWGSIEERLRELLFETANFKKVIISCRTQFFPEVTKHHYEIGGYVRIDPFACPATYLSFFDDIKVEKYLIQRFQSWFSKLLRLRNRKFVKATELVRRIDSLRFRPLLLAHIEDILASDSKNWNEYSMFNALLESWLLRERWKLLKRTEQAPAVSDLWRACTVLAETMHRTNTRSLSEGEVERICAVHPKAADLHCLDIEGHSLLNRNSKREFQFAHSTIQEFLLAEAILQKTLSVVDEQFRMTNQILRFILYALSSGVRANDSEFVVSVTNQIKAQNCRGMRIDGLCFPNAPFQQFSFQEASLERAQLRNADFGGADLSGANFAEADLKGAILRGANLTGANFRGADLSGADMRGADLRGCNFVDATLENSDLEDAIFDPDPQSHPVEILSQQSRLGQTLQKANALFRSSDKSLLQTALESRPEAFIPPSVALIEEIDATISRKHKLLLTGRAGAGKTTLALELNRRYLAQNANSPTRQETIYVRLSQERGSGSLSQTLIDLVSQRIPGHLSFYRRLLAKRMIVRGDFLFIVDDLESLDQQGQNELAEFFKCFPKNSALCLSTEKPSHSFFDEIHVISMPEWEETELVAYINKRIIESAKREELIGHLGAIRRKVTPFEAQFIVDEYLDNRLFEIFYTPGIESNVDSAILDSYIRIVVEQIGIGYNQAVKKLGRLALQLLKQGRRSFLAGEAELGFEELERITGKLFEREGSRFTFYSEKYLTFLAGKYLAVHWAEAKHDLMDGRSGSLIWTPVYNCARAFMPHELSEVLFDTFKSLASTSELDLGQSPLKVQEVDGFKVEPPRSGTLCPKENSESG